MANESLTAIEQYLQRSREIVDRSLRSETFLGAVAAVADVITVSLRAGNKLLIAGNGGSAGDAQHITGEFVSRLNYDRAPAAALALTVDMSVLTAIGNDYGYQHVFERQVLGLGRAGDVLLAISTSGRSPSIIKAMEAAHERNMIVVGFSGATGGDMPALADLMLHVPSDSTPLIQQMHITAGHIVCGLVEERLFPRGVKAIA